MTKHIYEKHTNCQAERCIICDGGLGVCTVCGCIEGSLATHCPGFNCWSTHGQAIYAGLIDYVDGEWVKLHRWVLTSVGEYDSAYECSLCKMRHMTSIDNPKSGLPRYGCQGG